MKISQQHISPARVFHRLNLDCEMPASFARASLWERLVAALSTLSEYSVVYPEGSNNNKVEQNTFLHIDCGKCHPQTARKKPRLKR